MNEAPPWRCAAGGPGYRRGEGPRRRPDEGRHAPLNGALSAVTDAERISVVPDELLYPPNLYEEAYEIINASGKVDTDLNNPSVHKGQYTGREWNYLTDTNNWFMMDSRMRSRMLHWVDRTPLEFAFIEDFDTIVGKWRAYMRYGQAHTDWRFINGAQVS